MLLNPYRFATAGAASIAAVDFEAASGYAVTDFVGDKAAWNESTPSGNFYGYTLTGTGRPQVDTHTAHKSGQVVDMAAIGARILTHTTELASTNHSVTMACFPDTMVSGTQYCANGALLRGQNDGASSASGYLAVMIRDGDTDVTYFVVWRVASGVPDGSALASSADLSSFYTLTAPVTMYAEISGGVITMKMDGTTRLSYDTSSDSPKYTAGNYVGAAQFRQYGGSGTNAQPFFDDWSAAVL